MKFILNYYSKLNKLRLQGNHAALLNIIDNSQQEGEIYLKSLLIYFNCLIEFGLTDQAYDLTKQVLNQDLSEHDTYVTFKLKLNLFEVLFTPHVDVHKYLAYFKIQINQSKNTTFNKAMAYECLSKAIQKGISFGQISSLSKEEVIEYQKKAIVLYDKIDERIAYLNSKKRLAQLYKEKPFRDFEQSSSILHELISETNEELGILFQPQCLLLLAEINFEAIHNNDLDKEKFNDAIHLFDEAEQLFYKNKHLLSSSLVNEKKGILFLKYGYKEGLTILQSVIKAYQEHHLIQFESVLWRKIADWYQVKGQTNAYLDAEAKANYSNKGLGKELSTSINQLMQMELEGRNGNLDEARLIYEKAEKELKDDPLLKQFNSIRANQLQQVGLRAESISIQKKQIKLLEPLKISPFLADAYSHLASNLTNEQPQEAIQLSLKALDIQDQLGDHIASLNVIRLIIETLINQQRLSLQPIKITPALNAALEEGFIRLKNEHTLKGRKAFGELLQTKGQVYFFISDLNKSKQFYREAEGIFINYQLDSSLSFLYSQRALLHMQTARKTGDSTWFNHAITDFSKAEQLTKQLVYTEQHWRTLYLQAACHYEIGQLETSISSQLKKWSDAEEYFERAYFIINDQRDNLDRSSHQNRQAAIIAFADIYIKICIQAFRMNAIWAQDNNRALMWLERMKAQALLDSVRSRSEEEFVGLVDSNIEFSFYKELKNLLR